VAEPKTKATKQSVAAFLRKASAQRRQDAETIIALMKDAAKAEPVMWGTSIIGFGTHHFKYESGREGDWPIVGLSPRKQNLVLYIMPGFAEYRDLLTKLGPHKTGKSCLYIKRLSDIDVPTLRKIVVRSVARMKRKAAAR